MENIKENPLGGRIGEREERINKLEELKKLGINPYPAKSSQSYLINDIFLKFNDLAKNKKEICIAGRLRSSRSHGNLMFVDLQDGSGIMQIALSRKEIGADKYKIFAKLIDIGDFIEIKGKCFITHKGEKSILAKEWKRSEEHTSELQSH